MTHFRILLLLLMVATNCQSREDGEFEPATDICKRCTCIVRSQNDSLHHDYSLLDCSTRNIRHMLASFPEDIFGNEETKQEIVFSLSGNSINSLQQLPATEAVLVFSCRHCNLTELASGLFLDAPNVIRLDLSWNRLTGDVLRPDVFRGKYSDNTYESIPLDELDLGNNMIESLDRNLFEHTIHLRRLSLARNTLGSITEETAVALGSLRELEQLDLSYTGLSELPREAFEQINGLRELFLQGNQFTTVPSVVALLKPTLNTLFVGDNPIQLLNDESFFDLDRLLHLNISGMAELGDLAAGTFSALKSLEKLSCSHNPKLTEFDMSDLKGLIRLREVDISYCNLRHLHLDESIQEHDEQSDIAHFDVFPKLRSVKLEGNPWLCDCELYETIESIKHILQDEFQSPHSGEEARCEAPSDLTALPLTELQGTRLCSAPIKKVPKIPIYEAPAFLRPRSIVLSIISVGAVLLIGFLIGFVIVCIKRKLKESDFGFTSPVRYTTVRNSTTSTVLQQP